MDLDQLIDHRIGRELNTSGRESLVLYVGRAGGYLGGPCISFRGAGRRRAAIHNPLLAYATIMGLDPAQAAELTARQQSVNDLVRDQLHRLLNATPRLSADDRRRLDLHLQSVRELESTLQCDLSEAQSLTLEQLSPGYDSGDGDAVLAAARAHMHVAALAVACGYSRAVVIQVGQAHDGTTRYRDPRSGLPMENFHYISHRRRSHDGNGAPIADAGELHHLIDRQFARTFAYLLELLAAHELPGGDTLLDAGLSVWLNDLAAGRGHSLTRLPYVIAGSAGGQLRQGEHLELPGGPEAKTHARLLNTIGGAVGLRDEQGEWIQDFGDPALPRAPLYELLT